MTFSFLHVFYMHTVKNHSYMFFMFFTSLKKKLVKHITLCKYLRKMDNRQQLKGYRPITFSDSDHHFHFYPINITSGDTTQIPDSRVIAKQLRNVSIDKRTNSCWHLEKPCNSPY